MTTNKDRTSLMCLQDNHVHSRILTLTDLSSGVGFFPCLGIGFHVHVHMIVFISYSLSLRNFILLFFLCHFKKQQSKIWQIIYQRQKRIDWSKRLWKNFSFISGFITQIIQKENQKYLHLVVLKKTSTPKLKILNYIS